MAVAFSLDHIILAAVKAHGLDIGDLPWEPCDEVEGLQVARGQEGARPQLYLHSDGMARLYWWIESGHVSYERHEDGDFNVVTATRKELPDTVLAAAGGRILSEMVDIPGAERMVIVKALTTRMDSQSPYDMRIQVEPLDIGTDSPIRPA